MAARPPEVLFYGVWPGRHTGHHLRATSGEPRHDIDRDLALHLGEARPGAGGLYPWTMEYRERNRYGDQVEGHAWHWVGEDHRGKPMTLLTMWDRSEDRRRNCCSSFVVMAAVTPKVAMRAARAAFPAVWERIEAHVGRAVVLAGEVTHAEVARTPTPRIDDQEPVCHDPWRRSYTRLPSMAEVAIDVARGVVEEMGEDVRLTRAIHRLDEARVEVSHFVDGIGDPPPSADVFTWVERFEAEIKWRKGRPTCDRLVEAARLAAALANGRNEPVIGVAPKYPERIGLDVSEAEPFFCLDPYPFFCLGPDQRVRIEDLALLPFKKLRLRPTEKDALVIVMGVAPLGTLAAIRRYW